MLHGDPSGRFQLYRQRRFLCEGQISRGSFVLFPKAFCSFINAHHSKRQALVLPLSTARAVHSGALSRSSDPILVNSETLKANRPSCVYFVRADANLCAKSKTHAIRHARATVPELTSTVDAI